MFLYRRWIAVLLSAVVYTASLFVSPDILVNQSGYYHDITIHSFDQLQFQGYLGKQVKSSTSSSFQCNKLESWDASFIDGWQYPMLVYLYFGLIPAFDIQFNVLPDFLRVLLFPFHSFW
jgi:hypothetical protein